MSNLSQTQKICRYIVDTRTRDYPEHVMDEALKCLVDWTGVCVGAYAAPEAHIVHNTMSSWQSHGQARYLWGGRTSPAVAALVNGTLSHCLDYDDTHIPSVVHASGPLWAAVLAIGSGQKIDEVLLLKAFITGFEIAARLGDRGVGIRLNDSGWHATPTLAKVAVAAAASVLLNLNEKQTEHALGIAATQASGLTASFGTMAKPFHLGKASMDGILAAELAQAGFEGALGSVDVESSLIRTLCQDPNMSLEMSDFSDSWEICRNSFKPYAACQLTHAAIDAARLLIPQIRGRTIEKIQAVVNPLAIKIAGLCNANTSTEGKFSLGYCLALGLTGHSVTTQDFSIEKLQNQELRNLASRVDTVADDSVSRTSARLHIKFKDGQVTNQEVVHAFGSIGNPLGWPELEQKFLALVKPILDDKVEKLIGVLRNFQNAGSLDRMFELTSHLPSLHLHGKVGVQNEN